MSEIFSDIMSINDFRLSVASTVGIMTGTKYI